MAKGWPGQAQPWLKTTPTPAKLIKLRHRLYGGQRAHLRESGTKAPQQESKSYTPSLSPQSRSVGQFIDIYTQADNPSSPGPRHRPHWGLRAVASLQLEPTSCPISEQACQTRRPHIALRNSGCILTHPIMTLSHSSVLTTAESQDSASSLVGLKRVSKNYIRPLRTSHSEANSTTSPPGVVLMLLIISGILLVCAKPDIWKSCFRNIQYILELKFLSSTVLQSRKSWSLQSFWNLDYVNPNTSGLPLNCIKQHGSCLPPSADPEPPSERKTETSRHLFVILHVEMHQQWPVVVEHLLL